MTVFVQVLISQDQCSTEVDAYNDSFQKIKLVIVTKLKGLEKSCYEPRNTHIDVRVTAGHSP